MTTLEKIKQMIKELEDGKTAKGKSKAKGKAKAKGKKTAKKVKIEYTEVRGKKAMLLTFDGIPAKNILSNLKQTPEKFYFDYNDKTWSRWTDDLSPARKKEIKSLLSDSLKLTDKTAK